MRSKHIFVITCQLIVLFHLTHTKVVSRKETNFRSLGYMPDQVALALRQMQNVYSAPRYQQEHYGEYTNPLTKADSEETPIKEIKARYEQKKSRSRIQHSSDDGEELEIEVQTNEDAKKRFAVKDVVIDFDELVNKVKDKLKDEFEEKKKASDKENTRHGHGKKDLRNNPDKDTDSKDISLTLKNIYKFNVNKDKANEPREAWKHFMDTKSPKTDVATSESYASHVHGSMKKSKKEVSNNDQLFEVADLTKVKDSYEDYITPKRDKMYASDTETETETKNPLPKNDGEPKESYKENEGQYEPKENYQENEELPKAADLLKAGRSSDKIRKIRKLDDPINFVKEEYDPNETEKPVELTEKAMFVQLGGDSEDETVKMKGTMIPTRQFFKMSSPNYFAKLPAVAEKYDFNEPLPDKDREPEKLKYFVNPPARINKKVKLQSSSDLVQENE